MKDARQSMRRAKAVVRDVLKEFEPTRGHFIAGTREFLLAMRSVVDGQIALLDRATKKKEPPPQA
jgi:hypothetical protein